ncbi:hypothetical protein OESDEN_22482 [Oesophagostomum dentatum]|uniref:Uncharacterized protein n=1 Tax=Oesophagostomum dentatum TaxID=61180 RepID=A0A0B1RXV0_OESDE|nr:hypothetical protein OESDEN_22482 [Oesophagostomum dentatum]
MGIGSFILIIACVVTLESRDKHAQVISEGTSFKRKQLLSIEERAELSTSELVPDEENCSAREESANQTTLNQYSIRTLAEVHRPRTATDAPLAEIDSLVSALTFPDSANVLLLYPQYLRYS